MTQSRKPFVYMATDENARFRWLCVAVHDLIVVESKRLAQHQSDSDWFLEFGPITGDCFVVKAQLDTHGTRRQLRARIDRVTRHLEQLGERYAVRFRLCSRPTTTTLEYRVFPADPDRFRTIRLTGRIARQMEHLDNFNILGTSSKALKRVLDDQLAWE